MPDAVLAPLSTEIFLIPKQCNATMAAACSEYLLFFSHDSELKACPFTNTIDRNVLSFCHV